MTASWSPADDAELDCLVHQLVFDYAEHRERCEACQPCRIPRLWEVHKAACDVCLGLAPLAYGTRCWARERFREHFRSCPRCLPCPSLTKAINEVIKWREARVLLSLAQTLRADQGAA